MFLVLSTAKEDRYRDNLLAALALPSGAWIQYRYAEELVAAGILSGTIKGEDVLIGYIAEGEESYVVPVRFARVADSSSYGSHFVFQLELQEFAYAEDRAKFTKSLRQSIDLPVGPVFEPENGKLVHKIENTENVCRTTDLKAWEEIARQLSLGPAFVNVSTYCTVAKILDEGRGTGRSAQSITPDKHGRYRLHPGHFHELRIYHFTPPNRRGELDLSHHGDFLFETEDPPLQILTAASQPIDSSYDVKQFRFLTRRSSGNEYSRIRVTQTLRLPRSAPSVAQGTPAVIGEQTRVPADLPQVSLSFDLDFTVHSARLPIAGTGALAGLLLSAPSIIAIYTAALLSQKPLPWIAILVTTLAGALAGCFAALGLKKPL